MPRLFLKIWALSLGLFVAVGWAGPQQVHIGAYVNDIQNLELKSHSYAVDLYLWMRWKDPELDPISSMEFVNPFELWGHTKTLEFPKPQVLSTGMRYQVARNLGRFSTKLALYDYPFDKQTLVVEIEDASLNHQELEYLIADEGVRLSPDLQIPGFAIGKPRIQVLNHEYPTRFGDTDMQNTHGSSRVRIEVPIERPVFTYSVKLMLPVLCVIFTAALMFFFSPTFVDSRVGIGITALLTIVALQITLNEDLPEVDYLVLMDKIYLASYFFVIASLATVVRTTRMFEMGGVDSAVAFNRKSLLVLSSIYVATVTAIVVIGWG